jgi:hypothetical protein
MASAISGDPARGIGLLNQEKYIGRVVWKRTTVTRGAQDSDDVTISNTPADQVRTWTDEKLRIIPDSLWQRVKARQEYQSRTKGTAIREALKRGHNARAGAGRGPKYLCSGLLKCHSCDASFLMTNAVDYSCSTYRYGGPSACANSVLVPRVPAERSVLRAIREKLLPHIADIKKAAIADLAARNSGSSEGEIKKLRTRLNQVNGEIERLVMAIASGTLKGSQALAQALPDREAEKQDLEQRIATLGVTRRKVSTMIPDLEGRIERAVSNLQKLAQGRGPEDIAHARTDLRRFFGGPVRVRGDRRGGKLIPVAVANVPLFALIQASSPESTDIFGSGGRI